MHPTQDTRKDGKRLIDDIDEFLRLVVASYLVQQRHVDRLIEQFRNDSKLNSWYGNTITGVTAFFVSRGVLTCWQVDKLRSGQYKGFFELDGYCLLDCLRHLENGSRYLTRRKEDMAAAIIDVWPGAPGKIEHRVVEVFEPPAPRG